MTIDQQIQAQLLLYKVAQNNGQTEEHVRQEIQAAIDVAWASGAGSGSLAAELFPDGKPTVDAFLARLAQKLQDP